METRHADVKAGLMVAISIAFLFVLVFFVGDWGPGLRGARTVPVIFRHVIGLQSNSPVTYVGVEIGRVRDIEIVELDESVLRRLGPFDGDDVLHLPIPSREKRLEIVREENDEEANRRARDAIRGRRAVQVTLEIRGGLGADVLRVDDLVRVESNFMGETTVVISPGSGRRLPGDGILLGRSGNLFTDISETVSDMREMFTVLSASLSRAQIGQIQGAIERISETAVNVEKIATEVRGAIEENRPVFRASLARFRSNMDDLRAAVQEIRPQLRSFLESGQRAGERFAAAAEEGRAFLGSNREAVASLVKQLDESARLAGGAARRSEALLTRLDETVAENRSDLRRAVHDLRWTGRHFKDATDRLRRQPWLLLRRPRRIDEKDTDLYFAARRVAEATERLDEALERFERLVAEPGAAERLDAEVVRALLEDVRRTLRETEEERDEVKREVLEELPERARNELLRQKREKDVREKE